MCPTIHSIQPSRSENSLLKRFSIQIFLINQRSENPPDNFNNFTSFCPIWMIIDFEWRPRCTLQFILYNNLAPMAHYWTVRSLKCLHSVEKAKMHLKTSITSWVHVRSKRFLIRNEALDARYNSSHTIILIRMPLPRAFCTWNPSNQRLKERNAHVKTSTISWAHVRSG